MTTLSSPESNSQDNRTIRKRNRVPLSCAPCRAKKLKCNRGHPCENCVKKGDAASCSYAVAGPRRKGSQPLSSGDMQKRIDRLENLVMSLMSTDGVTTPATSTEQSSMSPPSVHHENQSECELEALQAGQEDFEEDEIERVRNSMVLMKMHNDTKTSFYLGETHWATILSDIAEVKSYFSNHAREIDEQVNKHAHKMSGLGVFPFNQAPNLTQNELLAMMPPKHLADILVQRFFNSFNPVAHLLHMPTFMREYEVYWQSPSTANITWIALLYVMIALSLASYANFGDEPPQMHGDPSELSKTYFQRSEQCLLLVNYTRPGLYLIETMLLHIKVQHDSKAPELGLWVAAGNVIRLAMRMGYHREPSLFDNITPCQAEMRRRVWTFVHCLDVLSSVMIGLPAMIHDSDCDTELPRNLHDYDFGPDSTELPPAKPLDELTPITYMISKARIALVVGEIVATLNSRKSTSYEEVMKLDAKLRKARSEIPEALKFQPLSEVHADSAVIVIQRYSLDLLYQKGMCILHRRFVSFVKKTQRYVYSVQACVDASLVMLQHQVEIRKNAESRLKGLGWFVSSVAMHDFYLAATVVALCLHALHSNPRFEKCMLNSHAVNSERARMIAALEDANRIYYAHRDTCLESFKINKTLTIMLQKIHALTEAARQRHPELADRLSMSPDRPDHSAAMTLNMLSSGLSPRYDSPTFDAGSLPNSANGSFSTDASFWAQYLPDPNDISAQSLGLASPTFNTMDAQPVDWNAFETYISGTNLDGISNQFWTQNPLDFQMDTSADGAPSMFPPGPATDPMQPNLTQNANTFQGFTGM